MCAPMKCEVRSICIDGKIFSLFLLIILDTLLAILEIFVYFVCSNFLSFCCLLGAGGWGGANRLDYSYDDFLEALPEEELPKPSSGSVDVMHSRVKRHKKITLPMSDHKIKLIFNITGKEYLPSLLLFKNVFNYLHKILIL